MEENLDNDVALNPAEEKEIENIKAPASFKGKIEDSTNGGVFDGLKKSIDKMNSFLSGRKDLESEDKKEEVSTVTDRQIEALNKHSEELKALREKLSTPKKKPSNAEQNIELMKEDVVAEITASMNKKNKLARVAKLDVDVSTKEGVDKCRNVIINRAKHAFKTHPDIEACLQGQCPGGDIAKCDDDGLIKIGAAIDNAIEAKRKPAVSYDAVSQEVRPEDTQFQKLIKQKVLEAKRLKRSSAFYSQAPVEEITRSNEVVNSELVYALQAATEVFHD